MNIEIEPLKWSGYINEKIKWDKYKIWIRHVKIEISQLKILGYRYEKII